MILKDSLKTIAVSLIILSLVGVVYAWTEPTQNAPLGNTTPPLTNSATGQIKSGGLWIGSDATAIANNGNKGLIVENGNVGIGTTAPQAKLDVAGGSWNLDTTEGDFRVGDGNYRLKIGVATGGAGAGDIRMRAIGGTNRMILGAQNNDVLTISTTNNGSVGIGTTDPGTGGSKLKICDGAACTSFVKIYSNQGEDIYPPLYSGNEVGTCTILVSSDCNTDVNSSHSCTETENRTCLDLTSCTYSSGWRTYQSRMVTCIAKKYLLPSYVGE